MKLPRALAGDALASALGQLGYQVTRQTGSHLRLTTQDHGEHHVTIPRHHALRVGTLASIVQEVATHFGLERDTIVKRLFG